MRFMNQIKAGVDSEAGLMPCGRRKYTEEIMRTRVHLASKPLRESVHDGRVKLHAGPRIVIDGPFSETKQ
jgi:hypothetical protein